MTKLLPQKNLLAFWLLVLTDLVAILLNFSWLINIVKPLLMPALMWYLVGNAQGATGQKIIVTGLFFSWLGDVFLLLDHLYPILFIAGLGSFLITHLCYIFFFLSIKSDASSLLKKHPVFILLISCYGIGLVWLLFPYLGALKIPVMVYAAVICSMLLCSIHIYLKITAPANKYFITGAALFVLSDSLLAIDKFYESLPLAGIWIMLTYCLAQYFIVGGFIRIRAIKPVLM